ncbi:hypothetical protein [Microbacterium sp. NPDC090003]|uniref:hypothetical protein n=1 Tax=Microbacterium sp. NPDC090003 TaxID=3364203 RepID=UPI00382448EF
MFVGYSDEGLAAVGMYEPRSVDDSFYIRAVARAQRLAHQRVADELVAVLIDQITRDPEYVEQGYRDVSCEIHWRNHPSKKLFKRAGFACVGHDLETSIETWALELGSERIEFDDN